jgi:hypothetical protein
VGGILLTLTGIVPYYITPLRHKLVPASRLEGTWIQTAHR